MLQRRQQTTRERPNEPPPESAEIAAATVSALSEATPITDNPTDARRGNNDESREKNHKNNTRIEGEGSSSKSSISKTTGDSHNTAGDGRNRSTQEGHSVRTIEKDEKDEHIKALIATRRGQQRQRTITGNTGRRSKKKHS